jgi:serine/threonine protein kinase
LAELVKNGWRTNEEGVRNIALQVLKILVYLQKLTPPVFHRDIKPQNLIGGKDGKVYLSETFKEILLYTLQSRDLKKIRKLSNF